MIAPRHISIHRSINRPQVLLGGERKLVQCAILISVLVVISGMSLFSVFSGIILWAVIITILRKLGKNDEQMSQVYIRSLNYKPYYAARSGTKSVPKQIKDWRR